MLEWGGKERMMANGTLEQSLEQVRSEPCSFVGEEVLAEGGTSRVPDVEMLSLYVRKECQHVRRGDRKR